MNVQIANILKSKIEGAVYADRLTGMVREITRAIKTGTPGQSILKTFPVACDGLTEANCNNDSYLKNLVPNATYNSIIYFEDDGVVFDKKEGHYMQFLSTLNLVAWINLKKFQHSGCSISSAIIGDIINRFDFAVINATASGFQKIQILKISELPKSGEIFGKYSYDDKQSYLVYPYDFFALKIETRFAFNKTCLPEIILEDNDCIPA